MKHSLPNLALMAAIIVLGATADSASRGLADDSPGNRTVAAAARSMQAESALSADLRCRIDAFGHELAGQGSYQQLGQGPEKLLKLELKVRVADQLVTRQEICGPAFYYVRRQSPLAPASLGRVNLRQIRLAIARGPEPLAANPGETWILLGGLPKLLASLGRNFEFTEPRPDELHFPSAGGGQLQRLPVVVARGRWRKERLRELRRLEKSASTGAEQLPDEVEIVLSREDQTPPLFPYRITYFQEHGEAGQGRAGESLRPLLTLELYNVHRKGDLDPRQFDYQPGDQEVADLTQSYLQRLGLTKTR
jgi:hypothetical protein